MGLNWFWCGYDLGACGWEREDGGDGWSAGDGDGGGGPASEFGEKERSGFGVVGMREKGRGFREIKGWRWW